MSQYHRDPYYYNGHQSSHPDSTRATRDYDYRTSGLQAYLPTPKPRAQSDVPSALIPGPINNGIGQDWRQERRRQEQSSTMAYTHPRPSPASTAASYPKWHEKPYVLRPQPQQTTDMWARTQTASNRTAPSRPAPPVRRDSNGVSELGDSDMDERIARFTPSPVSEWGHGARTQATPNWTPPRPARPVRRDSNGVSEMSESELDPRIARFTPSPLSDVGYNRPKDRQYTSYKRY